MFIFIWAASHACVSLRKVINMTSISCKCLQECSLAFEEQWLQIEGRVCPSISFLFICLSEFWPAVTPGGIFFFLTNYFLLLCCPLKMSVWLYASVIIHPACFTVRSNHVLLMKVKKKKSKKWKELAEFLGMADFIVTSCALDSFADCHCRSLLWSVSIESVVKWGSRNRNPPGHWGSPWCYRDLCFFLWMCISRRGSALASEDGNVHSKIARPLL